MRVRVPSLVPLFAVRQSPQKANPELIKFFDIQDFYFCKYFFALQKNGTAHFIRVAFSAFRLVGLRPPSSPVPGTTFYITRSPEQKVNPESSNFFALPDSFFLKPFFCTAKKGLRVM